MWKIILRRTGEVLASGFETLAAADTWHDQWLDTQPSVPEFDDALSCDFVKE